MKYQRVSLAALAIAFLAGSGAAQAQSNVTLYGIVDVGIEVQTNTPGGTATGMRSSGQSGSRWGLRGSEDLGNGLKAVFQLESGFNVRNGNSDGRLFQRTAMVGLAGPWGELTFGRQYTSAFSIAGSFVPFSWSGQYDPISRFVTSRADNAVKYRGKFAGLDASAYYAFRNQDEQSNSGASATAAYGAAASYKLGFFRVMAAYDYLGEPAVATTTGDTRNYLAGVRADLGKARLTGVYRYRDIEQVAAADITSHLFSVGAGYEITPAANIEAGYYRETFKHAPVGYLGLTQDTWQQFAIRGVYQLSKRTNLYAVVAHARHGAINLGFTADSGGPSYLLAADKEHQTGGGIGIRHLF